MLDNDLRRRALTKLAAPDRAIASQLAMLAEQLVNNGLTSDGAVQSLIDTVQAAAAQQGRQATVSDIASILSNKLQNSVKETANTVGSTVKPPLQGLASKALKFMGRHKTPIALGIAGLGTVGGTYAYVKNKFKKDDSFAEKMKRMFNLA